MQTIAVDVMGGDKAPGEIAKGVFMAVQRYPVRIALIGPKEVLNYQFEKNGFTGNNVFPVEASQVVEMGESPTDAYREKPNSSIAVGVKMVGTGEADAFISAGNTGALVATSLLGLGTLPGIDRPALATLYSTTPGSLALFLDIGANADCRPPFLVQFAQLGSDYMTKVFKVKSPRVGLLSNGGEEGKGNRLTKETHRLLKNTPGINFIGDVEGFDFFSGAADVVVTDGFTGNVVLKLAEALTTSIFTSLKEALGSNPLAMASKFMWAPPIKSVVKQWDYSSIGGAPLLGVKGTIVKAHGRSDAQDLKNAIALAQRMVHEGWGVSPAAAPFS